ncbi:Fic family protein [Pokkaliibacter sp. MBI-7]|uniref:Fic family protein n=1 Tax=Pokkaliibacter sp. MBI-7 TaxID=3040600 RepID=UPI0024486956|nr:Fic family protein [Pokkaliibacter sp. MBI-7]MDH2433411.1 Fic family protein [Pokkaliibacter sp. MBI-7]
MKIPESPIPYQQLLAKLLNVDGGNDVLTKVMTSSIGATDTKGRYLHWEKVKYLPAPEGFTSESYWFAMKTARRKMQKKTPFLAKDGSNFWYCVPDVLQKELHWLDQNTAGSISMNSPVTNAHTRDTYLVSSLIEESISSSQLEGASTTRNVAKEMLRQNRTPKDHSEQMIYNNYAAMRLIREFREDDLTEPLMLELHRILTQGTLEEASKAGHYRHMADDIHVVDSSVQEVLHTPPAADELPERMSRLCWFANQTDEDAFVHPVIKAILLHFMIGYDHPFVDGNGRTARALFYWAMSKYGYWLMEYISISNIIKQAPVQYGKAYLHVETDENDLTYFLIHQVQVIKEAVVSLQNYLQRKASELEEAESLLERSRARGELNHRQLSLLKHALKNPGAIYRIQEHQSSHAISYQTARTDLLRMSDVWGLLRKRKYGREFVFASPQSLRELLAAGKV